MTIVDKPAINADFHMVIMPIDNFTICTRLLLLQFLPVPFGSGTILVCSLGLLSGNDGARGRLQTYTWIISILLPKQ